MREVEVRPASAQMKLATTMAIASTSLSSVGAGRLLNRLNQALAPSLAVAARSGLARTKETAMTKPKTSDQNTEWIMPRGTARRASRGLLGGMGRGVEAGDRVERVEQADEEGDDRGARLRHIAAARHRRCC